MRMLRDRRWSVRFDMVDLARRSALCLCLLLAACGGGGSSGGGGGGAGTGGAVTLVAIAVAPAGISLDVGATQAVTATGNYSDSSARDLSAVTWASSAPAVATVSASGIVTAVSSGTATITATSGGITGSTTVTVRAKASLSFLYSFGVMAGTTGGQPNGPLIQASDGNFYGTTRAGGGSGCPVGCGVLFKITAGAVASDVHVFTKSASDGNWPQGPLVQGRDGALYGTTAYGGTYDAGTVFRVTLDGQFSILHSFGGSATDGVVPTGGVIEGSDGNFYGVTSSGGANHCVTIPGDRNCGTVFRITPAGVTTILHSFGATAADGAEPLGQLIEGSDGNFYGTTVLGGDNSCSMVGAPNSCGTVFKMTPTGATTVIHSFGSAPTDGIAPQGTLIRGNDGAFYGTTASGGGGRCGGSFGCGTVFRITTSGTTAILYAFSTSSASDGYGPSPTLVLGRDGNFYGTTGSGGQYGSDLNGTVFRLTPAGQKTILYSFGPLNTNPSNPIGGLVQASDGALYGVTAESGSFGEMSPRRGTGTIFRLVL